MYGSGGIPAVDVRQLRVLTSNAREAPVKVEIRETIVDTDDRGFFAKLADEAMMRSASNVHLVSLEPEAVRGNHYHENQTEYIWVVGGRVRFIAVDNETGETLDAVLEGAVAPLVTIPPGISHAFENIGTGTNHLLCFSRLVSGTWQGDVRRNVILEK